MERVNEGELESIFFIWLTRESTAVLCKYKVQYRLGYYRFHACMESVKWKITVYLRRNSELLAVQL